MDTLRNSAEALKIPRRLLGIEVRLLIKELSDDQHGREQAHGIVQVNMGP